jgi:hypothetical protein
MADGVILAATFATGILANKTELEEAVRTELAVELARVDMKISDGLTLAQVTEALKIDGVTYAKAMAAMLATAVGKVAVVDNGDGTYTATFMKQDGTSTGLAVTYNSATGVRTITGTIP